MKVLLEVTSPTSSDQSGAALTEMAGQLCFKVSHEPRHTGLFLTTPEGTVEVLAVSKKARQSLSALASGEVHAARVYGTIVRPQLFRAVHIEVDPPVSAAKTDADQYVGQLSVAPASEPTSGVTELADNFARSLLALYDVAAKAPASDSAAETPRRMNNMYFHPSVEGRVLETIRLPTAGGRIVLALYDRQGCEVWFKSVERGVGVYRGPFAIQR